MRKSTEHQHGRSFFKRFFHLPLNILTYGSVVVSGIFLIGIELWAGHRDKIAWHAPAYYIAATGRSLEFLAVTLAYFAMTIALFLVIEGQIRNFLSIIHERKGRPVFTEGSAMHDFLRSCKGALKTIGNAFGIMVPAFFLMLLISFILGEMNAMDRVRLMDVTLLGVDHALLGGYAFMVSSLIPYPAFLIQFIIFSFENMVGGLFLAAFVIAYINMRVLRELVAAFCFCTLLMLPLWIAFPALSPQDRFVDNVYHLSIPSQAAAIIAAYRPDAQIAAFLAGVRTNKAGLADMPTSTMPSAHAAWAAIVGYYLFRAKKWLGWVALPFLLASTAGTVILAQHYFLDVLAGIFIAAIAIRVVFFLNAHRAAHEIF